MQYREKNADNMPYADSVRIFPAQQMCATQLHLDGSMPRFSDMDWDSMRELKLATPYKPVASLPCIEAITTVGWKVENLEQKGLWQCQIIPNNSLLDGSGWSSWIWIGSVPVPCSEDLKSFTWKGGGSLSGLKSDLGQTTLNQLFHIGLMSQTGSTQCLPYISHHFTVLPMFHPFFGHSRHHARWKTSATWPISVLAKKMLQGLVISLSWETFLLVCTWLPSSCTPGPGNWSISTLELAGIRALQPPVRLSLGLQICDVTWSGALAVFHDKVPWWPGFE